MLFRSLDVNQVGKLTIGAAVKNCGLPETCKQNEFSVHVYTGKDNNDEPKICVDGKYVIAKGLNNAGRGLNIVVVSNDKEIIRTGHFDTWQEGLGIDTTDAASTALDFCSDSTSLEMFLENLEDNVLVIVVTFDEASSK